ncbi:DUF1501 domain-containing protein [Baekduia sp. Peel2402]|uniref:DUF1501 domain-containing protein n=1 Tax=Baekduia sp. Peel2402 TaxID=3458296 RepID=UPI00403ED7B4
MAPRNCCNEFTRARFMQRGSAAAGAGLPAIEAGMPAPAGTGLSRRTFLSRSLGAALAVYGGSRLGVDAFEAGIAQAAGGSDRVLVSVFLGGGMDGLSVLAPTGDPKYATLRPTLLTPIDGTRTFAEDPTLQWTQPADALRTLYGEGKVTVMPAIGYDHPNQSHFTSRHFWEVGQLSVDGNFGWLGRYLDQHGVADNPLQGLSMNSYLSPGLAAASVPVAAVYRPDQFGLYVPGVGNPVLGPMYSAIGGLGALPTSDAAVGQARLVATEVDSIRTTLLPFQGTSGVPHSTSYPAGDFGRKLEVLAAMLAAGIPVRAVTVDAPGSWDSHADQANSIPRDVKAAFDTILAFQRDLEARNLADRVLIHVWTEFGRRPQENDGGTDHGAAGASFLIGSKVKGSMIGEFPGLTSLDSGSNLKVTSDFRGVYCSLLEQWYGVDAAPIIPGASAFTRPELIAA